jgi:uroporphyrinogen decarboxylase
MFDHKEADRIPILDHPWRSTLERWHREGLPKECSYVDYFGLDSIGGISADNTPRYPLETLEENDEYKIYINAWGVKIKDWKTHGGTPEFMDFTIIDRDSWQKAKKRMLPSDDRIDWNYLKNYQDWKTRGDFIVLNLCFGFDTTHSWVAGTERCLMATIMDPEWLMDIYDAQLELNLQMFDRVLESGYKFDAVYWCDDMGYKNNQFFSLDTYRTLLKPFHKRAVDWAHARGMQTELHSCGNINPFIPDLIDIGIDGLNPLEVKAGMNPLELKKTYGDKLLLHGGINAQLYDVPEKLKEEMERIIPIMKASGGYVFSSDHSVPDNVSLENFREIVNYAKELGKYD